MVSCAGAPGEFAEIGRNVDLSMGEQNVRISEGNEAFRWSIVREDRAGSQKLNVMLTSVCVSKM